MRPVPPAPGSAPPKRQAGSPARRSASVTLGSPLQGRYFLPLTSLPFPDNHLHLTVVQKPEILVQINAAFQKAVGDPNMQVTYGAPTVIYVSCKNEDEEIVKGCNAGVVMENMLLEAADLGLGAVYLFGVSQVLFANEEITKLLQIPEGFRTVSAIAVGTSADALQERTLGTDKISTTTL